MLIGYARVSTRDQTTELQTEALSVAGYERVFEDQTSGSREDRPGLSSALDYLRTGDTLVVWKLDRLGRTVKQLVHLVDGLQARGMQFRALLDRIGAGSSADGTGTVRRRKRFIRLALFWRACARS